MTTPDPTLEARAREIAQRLAGIVTDNADAKIVDVFATADITAALKAARLEGMEAAAKLADAEAAECARLALANPENSESRDRLHSRARTATHIAAAIRQAKETP